MNEQKRQYRIRNWRAYNAALVAPGSLTVGFDEAQVEQWYETGRSGRRGAPRRYSDLAVQCGLVIREVFHLPLRATAGLGRSVIDLLRVGLTTPDDRSFSRRAAALTGLIGRSASARARHIVIASTGLKVSGEGEWNGRQPGASRRRPWRKFHLAVDTGPHEGMAAELTAAFVGAAEGLPGLVEQLPADEPIESVAADGAYDPRAGHEALLNRRAAALIPPRGGAAPWPPLVEGQLHPRPAILAHIQQHGRQAWKSESGDHRRSLAETAMFRLKTLFGGRLKNRRFDTQATQAYARLAAMNIMTRLGMPKTVAVC